MHSLCEHCYSRMKFSKVETLLFKSGIGTSENVIVELGEYQLRLKSGKAKVFVVASAAAVIWIKNFLLPFERRRIILVLCLTNY